MNLLFIMSDEHSVKASGCYGHPIVKTPNIDRLAASGTRFENAYTNCPICTPARAGFATGRYIHEIGNWDNAHPYTGEVPGWGHRLLKRCAVFGLEGPEPGLPRAAPLYKDVVDCCKVFCCL